jgi:hypothetical protein
MLLFQSGGAVAGLPPKKKEQPKEDSSETAAPDLAPKGNRADSARISLDTIPSKIFPRRQERILKGAKTKAEKKTPKEAPKEPGRPDAREQALQQTDPAMREEASREYEKGLALLKSNVEKGKDYMSGLKKKYPQFNDLCNQSISDAYIKLGFRYIKEGFENHSQTFVDNGARIYDHGKEMADKGSACFGKSIRYWSANKTAIRERLRKMWTEDVEGVAGKWSSLQERMRMYTETGGYSKRIAELIRSLE